ncbi:hypothetical protein [Pseudomonas syringae group genomosp. 3]|uniref:hypothetical protein n=1 Tax=Pseudomonas syringae group genomosp. 3 TaxID=251701 RepID=UPI0001E27BD5|nr:hypothetical protein [Pseudomonas syringae group genomosp. 3]
MTTKGVVVRVLLYTVYVFCLLMYMMFYGSQYDWMEPSSIVPHIEDRSNTRGDIRTMTVIIAIFVQFLIFISCTRKESVVTAALLALVFAVYW